MTPKQLLEWIGDKALLAAALIWVALETALFLSIFLPIKMFSEAGAWVYIKVWEFVKGRRIDEEPEEE